MKLTKRILAASLSLLLVLPTMAPALAEEDPSNPGVTEPAAPTEEELAAARTALQTAVNKEINYAAYKEGTTADFATALEAAKIVLANEDATLEAMQNAVADMEEAKASLELIDGLAGAFAADNNAATMNIAGNGVIQMDWTYADVYPIDLSKCDLTKTYVAFTLTVGSENADVPVGDAFRTGRLSLRSAQTEGENNVLYDVAQRLPNLVAGANEIKICLADFTGTTGSMDWSKLERIRLYFDSTNGKTGPFTMKMENIRIIDETPADYKPVEGAVATFRDEKVYENAGGTDKTLPTNWVATTPVDLSGKDLSQVYLMVDYTLTNDTGLADDVVFNAGYFRLRCADTGAEPDGENNVGYSLKDLMDRGIIEQPVAGKNSVKIPLKDFNTTKGTMDWSTLNRFRMYFDNLPVDLEAGKLTLKFDSINIVDENVELPEGVLGVFANTTVLSEEEKALQIDWVKSGTVIDASKDFAHNYLCLTLNLTNNSDVADADAFKTGYIRLRSADTEGQENAIGASIAKLITDGVIDALKSGENSLVIPLSAFDDEVGEMDWANIDRFRLYIDSAKGAAGDFGMDVENVMIRNVPVDPTIVGTFSKAEKEYTATKATLDTLWVDADAPMDLTDVDEQETYLELVFALTNETGVADADAFKTGKILLASPNTPSEADTVGENSVSVSIAALIEDGVIDPLESGDTVNVLKVPYNLFKAEKGTFDPANVTRFHFFIDSTNQVEGTVGMDIWSVTMIDPTKEVIEPDVVYGDLTGDGEVKAEDALKALQAATGKVNLTEKEVVAADVDNASGVSANDALLILQYATQKILTFPVQA